MDDSAARQKAQGHVEREHARGGDSEQDARQRLLEGRDVKARVCAHECSGLEASLTVPTQERCEQGGEGNERVREARKGVAGLKDQMNRNVEVNTTIDVIGNVV